MFTKDEHDVEMNRKPKGHKLELAAAALAELGTDLEVTGPQNAAGTAEAPAASGTTGRTRRRARPGPRCPRPDR